jgi:hypothetical protein
MNSTRTQMQVNPVSDYFARTESDEAWWVLCAPGNADNYDVVIPAPKPIRGGAPKSSQDGATIRRGRPSSGCAHGGDGRDDILVGHPA